MDGQGSVLMVGRLLGTLTFPQRLNFTTLDREYMGSLHAVRQAPAQAPAFCTSRCLYASVWAVSVHALMHVCLTCLYASMCARLNIYG